MNNYPENAPACGTYQHYKGNRYRVIGMAQHSETEEWLVVYQALYGNCGFWLRPLAEWVKPVCSDASSTTAGAKVTKDADSANSQQRFRLLLPADDLLTELSSEALQGGI